MKDLVVQRTLPILIGRMKKYEPVDTRDFIPFTDFYKLSTENIKIAKDIVKDLAVFPETRPMFW